jgi:DNA-binding XRE family transcriptional regulator
MAQATRVRPVSRSKARRRAFDAGEAEVRQLRERYAISQALLARLLDVSLRSVSAAEKSPGAPPQLRRNLTQTSRLCQALSEVMDPAFVGEWLDQPNDMLAGLKPVEAIERGQIELVWQVVEGLRSGSPL